MRIKLRSLLGKCKRIYLVVPKENKAAFWEHTISDIIGKSLAIHIFSLLFLSTGMITVFSVIRGDGNLTLNLVDLAHIWVLAIAFIISGATSLVIFLFRKKQATKWLDTLLLVSAVSLMITRGFCASYELYVSAQYFRIILYWAFFSALVNYSPLRGIIVLLPGLAAFYIGNSVLQRYSLPLYSVTASDTIAETVQSLPIGINLALVGIVCYFVLDMNYKKSYREFLKTQQVTKTHNELVELTGQLNKANAQLLELSTKDTLTSLNNRRALDEYTSSIWQECCANEGVLSVMMIDADYFKAYNDSFGHQAGDDALRLVADVLKRNFSLMRGMLARYGGEEFIAVIPYMEDSAVISAAERIKSDIEAFGIANPVSSNPDNVLTLSIGIHIANAKEIDSIHACIRLADEALYLAKSQGRNALVVTR